MTDSQAERLRRAERMAPRELIAMARDWPVMESDAGDAFTGDRLIRALGEALAAALPLPGEAQAQRIDRAAWCGNSVYHDEYPLGQFDARCGACERSRQAIEQLLTDVALPDEARPLEGLRRDLDLQADHDAMKDRAEQAEQRVKDLEAQLTALGPDASIEVARQANQLATEKP